MRTRRAVTDWASDFDHLDPVAVDDPGRALAPGFESVTRHPAEALVAHSWSGRRTRPAHEIRGSR